MNKKYSIAQARDNLAAIIHDLELTTSVEITRRGQPVAVLLSKQEYERLKSSTVGFFDACTAFRKKADLSDLNIDPEEVFGGLRERDSGREVDL